MGNTYPDGSGIGDAESTIIDWLTSYDFYGVICFFAIVLVKYFVGRLFGYKQLRYILIWNFTSILGLSIAWIILELRLQEIYTGGYTLLFFLIEFLFVPSLIDYLAINMLDKKRRNTTLRHALLANTFAPTVGIGVPVIIILYNHL